MTERCRIEGCDGPAQRRGWCRKHYLRWWKTGDPLAVRRTPTGEPMGFLMRAVAQDTDQCLPWPYAKDDHGYGIVWRNGRSDKAHRVCCELANGPAPTGEPEVAHTCGNGHLGCVNPKHLRWSTRSDNLMDKVLHDTHNRGERHPENKLSLVDVMTIKALRGKEAQRSIAKRFGISPGHVSEIQTGKTWSWL